MSKKHTALLAASMMAAIGGWGGLALPRSRHVEKVFGPEDERRLAAAKLKREKKAEKKKRSLN